MEQPEHTYRDRQATNKGKTECRGSGNGVRSQVVCEEHGVGLESEKRLALMPGCFLYPYYPWFVCVTDDLRV